MISFIDLFRLEENLLMAKRKWLAPKLRFLKQRDIILGFTIAQQIMDSADLYHRLHRKQLH